MDVVATLIEIVAFDPLSNQSVTHRITNRNDPRATTYGDKEWLPILSAAPSIGTSVFNGAFTGAGQIELGDFVINLADGLGDVLCPLVWDGADVRIFAGALGDAVYPQMFRAVGSGAQRAGRTELKVQLTTRESLLNVNALVRSYAGLGQLEGDIGLKGVVKPWVLGHARFCRPVLIDAVRQIYQVSAYGPIQSVDNVFEGGQLIATYEGDKPLAQILADDGPSGPVWWTNLENGLIRLGRQPLYDLTCTVKGDTGGVIGGTALTRLGDIVARILSVTSAVPIDTGSLALLNQNVAAPFDTYLDTQVTVTEVLTSLMLSVGGYYTFNTDGELIFGLVRFGPQAFQLDGANRTLPTVLGINTLPTSAPVWYLKLGAEQCHFVHNGSDLPAIIAEQATAIGNAQQTANSKNKVFPPSPQPPIGAIDGDQWPDTSTSPTTLRRYDGASGTWVATSNHITGAGQVPYNDGQTVEDLKPAEPGATNGAPPGSPIGTREAMAVLGEIDINTYSLLSAILREDRLNQILDFRTFVEGQPVSTEFLSFRIDQRGVNEATAATFDLIGAKTPDGTGWVLNMDAVKINGETSLAQKFTEIGLITGEHSLAITSLNEVVIGPDGALTRSIMEMNNDGYIVGSVATNDGTKGSMIFAFDVFGLVDPNEGVPFFPLYYEDGKWVMNADLHVTGVLTVGTEDILPGTITVPFFAEGTDVFCPVGYETIVLEMPDFLEVGDNIDGGCAMMFFGEIDSGEQSDLGLRLRIYVDTGTGWVPLAMNQGGILTGGANTRFDMPISLAHAVTSTSVVKVRVTGMPYIVQGGGSGDTRPAYLRNPKLVLFGGKR